MFSYGCWDWVEINDGTSSYIQRYCDSTPGTVTGGTTITVKFHTNWVNTASGFFALVTGDATVTDVTGESVRMSGQMYYKIK